MSFKSEAEGNYYRHIVLAVRFGEKWCAIGLSRRDDLMNKELKFKSLSELAYDFKQCYEKNGHSLLKIKIGLPIIHSYTSNERIVWKHLVITLGKYDLWKDIAKEIDTHARKAKILI